MCRCVERVGVGYGGMWGGGVNSDCDGMSDDCVRCEGVLCVL